MRELRKREQEVKRLWRENEELRKKWEIEKKKRERAEEELENLAEAKQSKRPRFPNYSVNQQIKPRDRILGKSTGRKTKAEKLKNITKTVDVYPVGISPIDCVFDYNRVATHITNGKKETVCYRIYRCGRKRGIVEGVLPRAEYGIEIAITLAFLVYELELSFNQASQVLEYFCQLKLTDSEINSLLKQLAKHWESDYETIRTLIRLSSAVYIDETGWKVKKQNCFAWIFTTLLHTFFLFGESRKEEILDQVLPRTEFHGIGISDDYRIYEQRFKKAQKCWAHPLRKAIRLMLLNPEKTEYQLFAKKLIQIFQAGKTVKRNRKFTNERKKKLIVELKKRVNQLCAKSSTNLSKEVAKDFREFVNLQKSLIRTLDDLFTFVIVPEVEPTNNRAERGFRKVARARNNYQTSKSKRGAYQRSVIASVLVPLQNNSTSRDNYLMTFRIIQNFFGGFESSPVRRSSERLHCNLSGCV